MSERYRIALIRYDAAATRLHRAETERRASEAHYLAWLWSAQELERARAAPKTLEAAITAASLAVGQEPTEEHDMDGFPSETRHLKCHLTPEETRARTLEMLDELNTADKLEAKLNDLKKEMKDEIAGHESEARKLRLVVRDEAEMRDVECELLPDFKAGIVKVLRADTNEVVDTRPMTPDEKQLALPAIGRAKRRGAVANVSPE